MPPVRGEPLPLAMGEVAEFPRRRRPLPRPGILWAGAALALIATLIAIGRWS